MHCPWANDADAASPHASVNGMYPRRGSTVFPKTLPLQSALYESKSKIEVASARRKLANDDLHPAWLPSPEEKRYGRIQRTDPRAN